MSKKGGHDLPKGTRQRPKGAQKGVIQRDHQANGLNFSGIKTRSYLLGAPKKKW